jgi:hypothetical protein
VIDNPLRFSDLVPPPRGHKDNLARGLHELDHLGRGLCLEVWKCLPIHEPGRREHGAGNREQGGRAQGVGLRGQGAGGRGYKQLQLPRNRRTKR